MGKEVKKICMKFPDVTKRRLANSHRASIGLNNKVRRWFRSRRDNFRREFRELSNAEDWTYTQFPKKQRQKIQYSKKLRAAALNVHGISKLTKKETIVQIMNTHGYDAMF